jgi:hypothetical protein
VIVRADLPRGVQAAQIVHAAGESSPGNLPDGTFAFVLAVPNRDALEGVAAKLAERGIAHRRIEEPDAPWNGELMALGVVPARKEVLQRALSSLPLLR